MSIKLNNNNRNSSKQDQIDQQKMHEDDEDSMIELGQIAILSSSKASLRYRSSIKLNDLSASQQRFGSIKLKQPKDEDNKLLDPEDPMKKKSEQLAAAADDDNETDQIESQTCLDKLKMFKGYWYGILSAFAFCLSQVIMKRAKWLVGSDHSTIRYTITLIIMFTILKYKNMKIMGPTNQSRLLLFRGFLGCIGLITVYFSLMLLNPSDVVTLMHGSIIITGILSRIFLKEKLTIAHLIGLMLTVMGVIFISKPSVLFSNDDYMNNNNNNNNNKNTSDFIINNTTFSNTNCKNSTNCLKDVDTISFDQLKPILGVSLALCGSCASGIVYLVLKKLCNSKVHWATSTIYVCWFGLPVSILLSLILYALKFSHTNFLEEKKDLPLDIFYSVIASCLSVLGQILLNLALRYEDATKIAITKTIDVFFSFNLQYILLDISIDMLGLLGACSILTGTFFVLIFKLFENKYQEYLHEQSIKHANTLILTTSNNNNNDTLDALNKNNNLSENTKNNNINNRKMSKKSLILKIIFFKI